MQYALQGLYAFLACAGFCIMFNIHNAMVAAIACAGGALMWVAYLVCLPYGTVLAVFASSVTVAVFSQVMARLLKTPGTIFLIIGILPLVPGGGIYYTMYYFIQGNTQMFKEKGLATLSTALIIAVTVSLVSSVFRMFNKQAK